MNSAPIGRPWRRRLGITALFIALTGGMTWPQPLVLATHAAEHQDVYFNIWRLEWVAHALATSPLNLFNGNQFHPERGVLCYSDAMLVEGLVAAPLLWMGLPAVLVHNLMLLGAIVASGVGMYVLARHVSGSAAGGVIAGIVFAFAPYRFDHYMHMELQWTVWIPWAFWALQRTIESGSRRFGAVTGLFVALQMASSVYYGVFLGMVIAVVAAAQLVPLRGGAFWTRLRSLALGGAIAASLSGVYSIPYNAAAVRVGTRGLHEVTMFSARPRDYRIATEGNLLYGSRRGVPERQLFPGVLPLVLALVGLLLVVPDTLAIAYVLGLVLAFELSLGMYGSLYPFLWDHVGIFQGLRAPARAAIFCLGILGLLAARGYAALVEGGKAPVRLALAVLVPALVLLEYWVAPLDLVAFHNKPPALYAFLAQQPRGVVAEFPMPRANALPGHDMRYVHASTFHWMPIVNGYSGYYPPSYVHRLRAVAYFPNTEAIEYLKADGVRYVIVHSAPMQPGEYRLVVDTLALQQKLPLLGDFEDGWGRAAVFRLQ